MEKFILPQRIKKKAIKDDQGRIVGHEQVKEPYLPQELKGTHELKSFKSPTDPDGKKSLKVAVQITPEERNEKRLNRIIITKCQTFSKRRRGWAKCCNR